MLGTALSVGYSLATGFERAAEAADLPDVIARFEFEDRAEADRRVAALPNLEARAYRAESTRVRLSHGTNSSERGVVHLVGPGRRGYAIVEGRDVRDRPGELVVERGLAEEWDVRVGERLNFEFSDVPWRVVGIAVGPDNVAFPLARAPRIYISLTAVERIVAPEPILVNLALIWTRDPSRVDVTLQQARATSYGVDDLRFVTRDGVRVLLDQAAGIVVALLVAFAVITLVAAGVMLGVSAHADVQRRLQTIGVQRALGFPRRTIVGAHAVAAVLVALPAGVVGLAAGALIAAGPTAGLLRVLNELSPGAALLGPLAAGLVLTVGLVGGSAAWPAWRATRRATVALLQGAELGGRAPKAGRGQGFFALGMTLARARRGRFAGTVLVLAACVGVVALLLALASLLGALRNDPGTLGKRYDTTARLPAALTGTVRELPGVKDAAPRYVAEAADSFALGEPVRLIAMPGDHTKLEAAPLASGRRVAADGEAEVGLGLAGALNLRVGGTLATQLPSGAEARFRVVGIVRALEREGRVAYVRPPRLLAGEPGLEPEIAIRLEPGADRAALGRRLRALGAEPARVGGATSSNAGLLDTLAALLRAVAGVTALVCLYALVQALTLVALERRPTIAVLRATGAGTATVAFLLAGVVLATAVPAVLLGLVLEVGVLAPVVGRLAAGYADLSPRVGVADAVLVAGGATVLCALAAGWVARRTVRAPVVEGLRAE